MATTRKVIIIGSGPAGYTAAIYAARANLAPLLIAGLRAGGQLMLTTLVENVPGFVDGVMGPELMETMRKQAERFGTDMIAEDVTAVDFTRRPFAVRVGETTYEAETVIVATGASSKFLGLPGERELLGRGVSTCATCDGFFFKDQNIMVVGGGDSALEEALFLARLGRKVEVVHRRDTLRAS
jgi:thioredoxin reductase (NADPH)